MKPSVCPALPAFMQCMNFRCPRFSYAFLFAFALALAGIAMPTRAQVPPSVPASSSAAPVVGFRPQNTGYGLRAGQDFTTGGGNILLGVFPTPGVNVTSGSYNIIIGYDVRPPSQAASHQLNIGNLIYATGIGTAANLSTGSVGIGTTNPTSKLDLPEGEVRVGTSGAACAPSNAGAIRYADKHLLFCDGGTWRTVSTAGGP
jgi:hypothetical protein